VSRKYTEITNPCNSILLKKLADAQQVKIFPALHGTHRFTNSNKPLELQQPTTCPYPEPDESSPYYFQPISLAYTLILPSYLFLGLPNVIFILQYVYK
jgi:hypothetical protein